MSDSGDGSSLGRWIRWVRVIAILVPVVGAIPTAANVYHGWKNDIPWWQVPQRAEQARLWERNAECKFEYQPISAGQRTVVHIGACPATGDIALKVSAQDRDPVYSWIAHDTLPKPGQTSSFFDHLIPPLRAAEGKGTRSIDFRIAQDAITIVCQYKQGANIVRLVKEGGKCFREMFSPFQGRVLDREEVPCDTKCPKTSAG